jgi:uncharacterized LabA/DUF88 family protein
MERIMDIAILLDGDFTRRLLTRRIHHRPSVPELEVFCTSILKPGETLTKTYFYDCPPFDERRPLPVSRDVCDFSKTEVFTQAMEFQECLKQNPFFVYRSGHLSFDGWTLTDASVKKLMKTPRPLIDNDFDPVLTQKQVDMKIGLDVAKLSLGGHVGRILLATSDADFIPAIHFARANKVEVVLISDVAAVRRTKSSLLKAFTSHRIV